MFQYRAICGIVFSFLFAQVSVQFATKENSTLDKQRHELIFNKDQRPAWATGYLNRSVVEEKCKLSKPCFASDEVVPLCATDSHTYLNPGVLKCAQQCNKALTIGEHGFGPCPGHVLSPFEKYEVTEEPTEELLHESSPNRLKIKFGLFRRALKWLGFHVHDDGGIYFADEKEHTEWWNI